MTGLTVQSTAIPGLLVVRTPLHRDLRGWFKESWNRSALAAAGLGDFVPVQHNVAFNEAAGTTRGIHAEPWDKLVTTATGQVFGAWVDLRPGLGFGEVVTLRLGPDTAVFVPRGVGNAYQTLEPGTTYSYLVNEHWDPDARETYTNVDPADPALSIPWPIPLSEAVLSPDDLCRPPLAKTTPLPPKQVVILGAQGQVGRALSAVMPDALRLSHSETDITVPGHIDRIDWRSVGTVINAAAFTRVDAAESPDGRRLAWATNAQAVARLVQKCRDHGVAVVHVSSDYVFDGTIPIHDEAEPFSPLGVYGQTKAAADTVVATWTKHYIVRTSWVVGCGRNFLRTMSDLARRGVCPAVVDDEYGRLTMAGDLAEGIKHLLTHDAPFGVYNLTNDGDVRSWADIAEEVFRLHGRDPKDIQRIRGAQGAAGEPRAPRPRHSTLNLSKIVRAGFSPPDAAIRLPEVLADQMA